MKAKFLDPIDGASRVEAAIKASVSAATGFLHVKSWGDQDALVSLPISNPWAIICNQRGLWLAISGLATPHDHTFDENWNDVDEGPEEGLIIADASFSANECAKLVPIAETTMTAIINAGR